MRERHERRSRLFPKATLDFYRRVMSQLGAADIPFLVGGSFALEYYAKISRHTKDFDVFLLPRDHDRAAAELVKLGYRTELTHPHWLGKVFSGEDFMDLVFSGGNGVAEVDEGWFEHAREGTVLGMTVRFCPAEEIIWSKSYVMERERFDGADVIHLLHALAEELDWKRLLARFDSHWRVLLSHLLLFGFVYPGERTRIPVTVMRQLTRLLEVESEHDAIYAKICQGGLLSREQYLVDLEEWGYTDARLVPAGKMTAESVAAWTAAIEKG